MTKKPSPSPIKIKLGPLEIEGPLGSVLLFLIGLVFGLGAILAWIIVSQYQQPSFIIDPIVSHAIAATVTAQPYAPTPTFTLALTSPSVPTSTSVPTSRSRSTPTSIPVWKTNIKDGDSVAHTMTLIADYSGELDNDLWVFVMSPNGRYYPQSMDSCRGAITPKVNGKWEMRIGLGQGLPNETGDKFDIVLAVAKSSLDSQFISLNLMAWCVNKSPSGFETLPIEVSEVYRITNVIRTSEMWGKTPNVSNAQLEGNVSITNLSDGDVVTNTKLIVGQYTPATQDDIWVLVYPTYGRWYPQSESPCRAVHTRRIGGQWQVPTQFGDSEVFDVVVVLATREANEFFETRQKMWCKAGYYPGLLTIELPSGIDEKARVRVRHSQ